MSDPLEKLNRLGDALEGAPMPLPASEIRARGDRIRRRKHALVAGASAAVVAAVAVPVVAFTVGGSDDRPDISPAPTVTDPEPTAPLSAENLLTSEDAIYPNGGADWRESDTYPGDGQAPASLCQQGSFAGLGADLVFVRKFEFVITDTGEVDFSNLFTEVVAQFPDEAGARSAYDTIQDWYADCRPPGTDGFRQGEVTDVPVEVEGTAERRLLTAIVTGTVGNFLDIGLVLSGNRIALLEQETPGQDYIWPKGSPVEQMLPAAAERLVLGNRVEAEPTGEGRWVTTIPEDFPLDSGFPEDDGSSEFQYDEPSEDAEALVPAGDLEGCQSIDSGSPVDRLTTRLDSSGSDYDREVALFADDTAALGYVDSIQDAFSACAAQPGSGYVVDSTGDDPAGPTRLDIRWSEGVDRQVVIVWQAGNAVLVAIESDQGGGAPNGDVDRMWTGIVEGLARLLDEVTALGGGGALSVDPPMPDPAGTTAIPDELPLDLDMADMSGDGGEYRTPYHPDATERGVVVDLCGQTVWPATGSVDRLWALATGPEYGDSRELVTFATVEEAVATVDAIRAGLDGCTGEGNSVWTEREADTGYDSVTFAQSFTQGLGLFTYQVSRVGNAVLLVVSSGEGSLADLDATAEERTGLTKAIAPSLCVFTVAGCP